MHLIVRLSDVYVLIMLHFFKRITYMNILHPHKSCCLLVYPSEQPSRSGPKVPHKTEPPVENACWPKQQSQAKAVSVYVKAWRSQCCKNTKTTLSRDRRGWAPTSDFFPDQSVLIFRNARLWKYASPTGELANFSQIKFFLQQQAETLKINSVLQPNSKQAF